MEHLDHLPNEISTEFASTVEVAENPSIQAFLKSLTEDQKRRFNEFAHHLFYLGMEYGATRRSLKPTEDQLAQILVTQTVLYAKGAGESLDPPQLNPFDPSGE